MPDLDKRRYFTIRLDKRISEVSGRSTCLFFDSYGSGRQESIHIPVMIVIPNSNMYGKQIEKYKIMLANA